MQKKVPPEQGNEDAREDRINVRLSTMISVLVVSPSDAFARGILKKLRETKTTSPLHVPSIQSASELLSKESFPLLLCDGDTDDKSLAQFLHQLKKQKPEIYCVVLVDAKRETFAEQLLEQGADNYLLKGDDALQTLPLLVRHVADLSEVRGRERKLEEELSKQRNSLREINRKLEAFSIFDELTGLYNHRYFHEKLHEEFLRSKRYTHAISCLMIDFDHFKSINDVRGHLVGDEILKEFAHLLQEHSREMDILARYGGEEFVALLPHVPYQGAEVFAERIRKAAFEKVFLAGRYDLKLTVSVGISSYPDDSAQKNDDMIFFAEKALLRAKTKRNQNSICCYAAIMKEIEAQTPTLRFSGDKMVEFRKRLLDVSEMAKRAYIESTKTLIYALEAKDKYTLGHASRVAQYSALVALEMDLTEDEASTVEHAGLLHDVGKVCISDEVLLKPGAFTIEEYEKMKEHPMLGYQLVKPIKFLKEEASIILHHHEWFNGQGYPHHLKGKEIPIGARIVSILDAYDTMHSAGARYKKPLSVQESVDELIRHAGTQFDPEVVAALVRVLTKRGEIAEKNLANQK